MSLGKKRHDFNIPIGLIFAALVVASFGLGWFGGREHLRHQFQSRVLEFIGQGNDFPTDAERALQQEVPELEFDLP